MDQPIVVLPSARREMEGVGGRGGRAALPRCIALPDPVPVHAQLSLHSRRLSFFTTPLLLNLHVRLSSSQSQRHRQVLLSTMTTNASIARVCIHPAPERCPVLCALTPFLPSVCCSALTLCVLPCSCAPTATLSQSKLCRRRAACRAAHALRARNPSAKSRVKRATHGSEALHPPGAGPPQMPNFCPTATRIKMFLDTAIMQRLQIRDRWREIYRVVVSLHNSGIEIFHN